MKYDDARLWDGSDPDYAPGLMWSKGVYPRWKAPARYVKAGYEITSIKLEGTKGDGNDHARAEACRTHTVTMLRWWQGDERGGPEMGTWAYVIARWLNDEYSTMRAVKANTAAGYREQAAIWERIIGDQKIHSLDYQTMMGIMKAMKDRKRSVSYIRRAVTTLRMIAKYASLIEQPGIEKVRTMLTDIRISTPPSRSVEVTRDQVQAIVSELDARNMPSIACGILIQYELILRAVDVRGHWLPSDGKKGGITRTEKGSTLRWQDGMTWDMMDENLTTLRKTISKTAKSMPEAYEFDLTDLPEIRARLRLLRNSGGIGPVITSSTGAPYAQLAYTRAFSRARDALGLPKEIQCMDLRSGGVTEAKAMGVNPLQLRDAAQHRHIETTSGYARARSDGANNVVKIRKAQ